MHDLQGKRVLITGAGGFLGANLVYALARQGAEVHALVRRNIWRLAGVESGIAIHRQDLCDFQGLSGLVKTIRPQIIFHSAVHPSHPLTAAERLASIEDNITATAVLIEALRPIDFDRLVHLGSSLEYGAKQAPMKESDLLEPFTYRGATKAAAALLCLQMARGDRRPVAVVRPFSVFGYWESAMRIVPTLMLSLLRGAEMRLAPGDYRRDFIFIEDVIEACLRAATAPGVEGEIINVGSGLQWSNEELIGIAEEVTGIKLKRSPQAFENRPPDVRNWVADIRNAERLLDWKPRYDLRAGLSKTFDWFRDHQHLYAHAK
jgi:nucleoside-diphosphate-sugar epimerase